MTSEDDKRAKKEHKRQLRLAILSSGCAALLVATSARFISKDGVAPALADWIAGATPLIAIVVGLLRWGGGFELVERLVDPLKGTRFGERTVAALCVLSLIASGYLVALSNERKEVVLKCDPAVQLDVVDQRPFQNPRIEWKCGDRHFLSTHALCAATAPGMQSKVGACLPDPDLDAGFLFTSEPNALGIESIWIELEPIAPLLCSAQIAHDGGTLRISSTTPRADALERVYWRWRNGNDIVLRSGAWQLRRARTPGEKPEPLDIQSAHPMTQRQNETDRLQWRLPEAAMKMQNIILAFEIRCQWDGGCEDPSRSEFEAVLPGAGSSSPVICKVTQ